MLGLLFWKAYSVDSSCRVYFYVFCVKTTMHLDLHIRVVYIEVAHTTHGHNNS